MVPKKNKSKRLSCAQKYKQQRNSFRKAPGAANKEKLKKQEYKSRKKADPGIPASAPFRDEVIAEAQVRKERIEQEKERQRQHRLQRQQEGRQSGSNGLAALVKDAQERDELYESQLMDEGDIGTFKDAAVTRKDNSRRAYLSTIKQLIEEADILLQILDVRDPMGTRAPQIEEMIMNSGKSGVEKQIIFVLNKADLVPADNAERWEKYFSTIHPTVLFKSTPPLNGVQELINVLKKTANANGGGSVSVGLLGFPNVGKSSIINALKRGENVCTTSAQAGFTKGLKTISISKWLKVIDSPGIVPFQKEEMLLKNCIKLEAIEDPVRPIAMLLKHVAPGALHRFYKLPAVLDERDASEFLTHFSRIKGRLGKGGVPHLDAAARMVLTDWNAGRIPYSSKPPQMEGVISSQVIKSNMIELLPREEEMQLHLQSSEEESSSSEEEEEDSDMD